MNLLLLSLNTPWTELSVLNLLCLSAAGYFLLVVVSLFLSAWRWSLVLWERQNDLEEKVKLNELMPDIFPDK